MDGRTNLVSPIILANKSNSPENNAEVKSNAPYNDISYSLYNMLITGRYGMRERVT